MGKQFRVFSYAEVDELVDQASNISRRRQHHNIHTDYEDPCQRLLNAIEVDSYIRPHRHKLDPKVETLVALAGKFAVFLFDDDGIIVDATCIGSEKYKAQAMSFGLEIQPAAWHTVIALVPGSVLLEIKAGPFRPDAGKEFAAWAPEEGAPESVSYLQSLRRRIPG
jgi:cupin fold WbuC family metalloprotein